MAISADTLLEQLGSEKRTALDRMEAPQMPSTRPPKVRYSHEGMIELLLAEPWTTQNQLAAHFGRSPSWISTILTSDAFKAQLEARRAELIDPELRLTLRERFTALTAQSLKILQEKLTRNASDVPDQLALRAAELGAKSLGLGGNAPPQVIMTSEARLEALAHRLVALKGGQGTVIDAESREV